MLAISVIGLYGEWIKFIFEITIVELVMQKMSELIKDRPLAYGFIEDGNLHSLIKWPFTEEVSVFQPVGKSLVDFIRFDSDFMRTVFQILLARYVQAREYKDDYNFIADVLWEVAMQHRLIGTNNYLTVYALSYIHLLLDEEVDPRILAGEQAEVMTQYIRSVDIEDFHGFSMLAKRDMTDIYIELIEERQKNVEETLSMVLKQRNNDGLKPIQRYYELEQTDEEFRQYWHSDFIMKLGKKADGYDVQQFVVLENIGDMLRYELVQTLIMGIGFKRCENCGMLFVPSGRSDTLYCDFRAKGETQPCNKIGANRKAKEKVAKDPVLQEHRRAYQRLNKRKEYGYMEEAEFKAWADEAALRRKQCQEGTITFDEYKAWLDETSLQEKK